jgi:cytochrome c
MLMRRMVPASICMISICTSALAEGNAANGEMIFQRCVSCHSETAQGQNKGPSLKGLVGRPIASDPGYGYSDAMRLFAGKRRVWDAETLDLFLKAPLDVVKGTKMMTAPVRRDSERIDLIAFLRTL